MIAAAVENSPRRGLYLGTGAGITRQPLFLLDPARCDAAICGSQGGSPMCQRLAVLAINAISIGALLALLTAGLAIAGTPFGGDESGFIPPNRDVASCEDSVGKELGKAAACILRCHKQASG